MNPSAHRSSTSASASASGRCPRCGHAFDCGMRAAAAAGQQTDTPPCWCRAMPALPTERLVPGRACLCPECLADEIARAHAASDAPETPGPAR
ncbi:cysteine-rich CWC family protein [Paraburkholderia flava]|uniref:cysteine-rich CWC family protein n=1 Tax=Paraburkholderia flava TaxID=2547393 RepID=UPI00105FF7DB|nr:cysteine-rich CWC family protein [Paraburkholderia flava]